VEAEFMVLLSCNIVHKSTVN